MDMGNSQLPKAESRAGHRVPGSSPGRAAPRQQPRAPLGGARCGPGTPSARAAGPRHGAAGARPGQSLRPTPRRCPAAAAAWARCSERSCHWGQGAGTRKRGGHGALLAHAHTHTHTHPRSESVRNIIKIQEQKVIRMNWGEKNNTYRHRKTH